MPFSVQAYERGTGGRGGGNAAMSPAMSYANPDVVSKTLPEPSGIPAKDCSKKI